MNIKERKEKFMPDGIPKNVRIYDAPDYMDRYTVVYTGNFKNRNRMCYVRSMSSNPTHPQGIGMIEDYDKPIDYPSYKHLGKKIAFKDLPKECQDLVIDDYIDFWGLKEEESPGVRF